MAKGAVERKISELSHLLEIDELLDRIVRTYSGGQKRRLEIALGIIHEPEILFMDEPTTGLDPQNRAKLWSHIRELKEKGMTIFLTTHYLEEADALANRLSIIDHGQIVAEGSPQELKRQISGDTLVLKLKSEAEAGMIFSLLEKRGFVNEAAVDGLTLNLYSIDGPKTLPILFDLLKENSIDLDTVSLSAPSLNDVFLKKTGRLLRDTGKDGSYEYFD